MGCHLCTRIILRDFHSWFYSLFWNNKQADTCFSYFKYFILRTCINIESTFPTLLQYSLVSFNNASVTGICLHICLLFKFVVVLSSDSNSRIALEIIHFLKMCLKLVTNEIEKWVEECQPKQRRVKQSWDH